MCKCTPSKRTPWCGKPGCEMPESPEPINRLRDIPLTQNFDITPIGRMTLMVPFEDIVLAQMVFAPAYRQNEDGTIEITEFSLIPAANAVDIINRGLEHGRNNEDHNEIMA